MQEIINEKISVITIFRHRSTQNEVLPWKIKWQGRIYHIQKIGFHHLIREGRKLFHIFSVTDGNLDFRLRFDTENLHWILEEVFDGALTQPQ